MALNFSFSPDINNNKGMYGIWNNNHKVIMYDQFRPLNIVFISERNHVCLKVERN